MKGGTLWTAMGGLVGWAAAFAVVYALHGVGCATGWDRLNLGPFSLQRVVLVLSWLVCVALLTLWLWRVRAWRGRTDPTPSAGATPLLQRLAEMSAWAGLAAILVSLLPTATHALCL